MSDPLYELLSRGSQKDSLKIQNAPADLSTKYLSRILSLRLADLTTTEPQSVTQASHSNLLSIQALSSRSYKTTIASADHLSTLKDSLPHISKSTKEVRESIPALDESAVTFASAYSRSRDSENASLTARKEAQLLARQADKLQEILELPSLLSAAIASAGSGATGSANYSQALDLFAHIKRLQIIFPDSQLIKSILTEAETAMKDMTTNLLTSLRSQNIRLAAAIRTVGWLRRVVPELSNPHHLQPIVPPSSSAVTTSASALTSTTAATAANATQSEGSFAALFLTARLATFISMTQALAPLRELADQETERRLQPATTTSSTTKEASSSSRRASSQPPVTAGPNNTTAFASSSGHQTERYLKRYIEIFREQSFSTISMYRNIFPSQDEEDSAVDETDAISSSSPIPPSLQTFPLHLVEMLMEILRAYLPNVTDAAARESLLMQVLYAANSLGRLGADFSMMIALLEQDISQESGVESVEVDTNEKVEEDTSSASQEDETSDLPKDPVEPEWLRIIKKHRIQSARLDALAAGQDDTARRSSQDVAVR